MAISSEGIQFCLVIRLIIERRSMRTPYYFTYRHSIALRFLFCMTTFDRLDVFLNYCIINLELPAHIDIIGGSSHHKTPWYLLRGMTFRYRRIILIHKSSWPLLLRLPDYLIRFLVILYYNSFDGIFDELQIDLLGHVACSLFVVIRPGAW